MDFIAYLETSEEYDPHEVTSAIISAFELGSRMIIEKHPDSDHAQILDDITDNIINVERE